MYVRRKQVGDYAYSQLVETYREGGKVRQRGLAHLGRHPTTLEEAIARHRGSLKVYREILNGDRWSPSERAMWTRSAARHEKKLKELTQLQRGLDERSD